MPYPVNGGNCHQLFEIEVRQRGVVSNKFGYSNGSLKIILREILVWIGALFTTGKIHGKFILLPSRYALCWLNGISLLTFWHRCFPGLEISHAALTHIAATRA